MNFINKKNVLILIILAIIAISLFFLFNNKKDKVNEDNRIKIVTSFYPLYFFTSEIAKDKAIILNITPSGAEPHEYEPTARDMATIENSNLLVLNGEGLESWSENIKSNIDKNKTKIIIAGDEIATKIYKKESNNIDPHIWLSPILAKQIVDKIESGLSEIDPNNSLYYKINAEILKDKLTILDEEFRQGLNICKSKNIIVSHSAFAYLAKEYNLNQIPIAGLSTEEEPSVKEMTNIAKFAKENNVKYIFFENLVSPKISETIAKEIGAQTLSLNPIEGLSKGEIDDGRDYFSEMRYNLINLKIALECK